MASNGGFTAKGGDEIINKVLRGKQHYIGLHTNAGEVNKASYVRKAIVFTAPLNGETFNNADIEFPVAQEDWGIINKSVIYDAESGGNAILEGDFDYSKEIRMADQYVIPKMMLLVRPR